MMIRMIKISKQKPIIIFFDKRPNYNTNYISHPTTPHPQKTIKFQTTPRVINPYLNYNKTNIETPLFTNLFLYHSFIIYKIQILSLSFVKTFLI